MFESKFKIFNKLSLNEMWMTIEENMKIMPGKWLINDNIEEHNKHGEIGHFCGFENDYFEFICLWFETSSFTTEYSPNIHIPQCLRCKIRWYDIQSAFYSSQQKWQISA